MPQVTIKIGLSDKNQHLYNLTADKVKYLLKFADSITGETEQETALLKEIETGLKEVKRIRKGELPRKTLKQMLSEK